VNIKKQVWSNIGSGKWHVAVLACALVMTVDSAVANDVSSTSPDSDAGVLRKFEKSIQPDSGNNNVSPPQREPSRTREEHDDGIGHELGEELATDFVNGLVNVVSTIIVEGGRATMQRVAPDDSSSSRRNDGDALIPFVRYDFGYQRVSSNIEATFNRLEGGYGPFALYLEEYGFHEAAPVSVLRVQRQMFFYRVAGQHIEIDFGLGRSVVSGAKRTAMNAFSLRGKFMLTDNASVDFTPVWGNGMDDYELALRWGRQFGSFAVGYRSLQTSGASLNGPFVGFALYF